MVFENVLFYFIFNMLWFRKEVVKLFQIVSSVKSKLKTLDYSGGNSYKIDALKIKT